MKIKKIGYPGLGIILQPSGLRVMLIFVDFIVPMNTKAAFDYIKRKNEEKRKKEFPY